MKEEAMAQCIISPSVIAPWLYTGHDQLHPCRAEPENKHYESYCSSAVLSHTERLVSLVSSSLSTCSVPVCFGLSASLCGVSCQGTRRLTTPLGRRKEEWWCVKTLRESFQHPSALITAQPQITNTS